MPSKDQRSIDEEPTSYEKWDRAKSLMLESLHKPDNHLRSCAHNQKCYYELMEIKDQVIELVKHMSNPRPFIPEGDDENLTIPTLAENTVPTESYVQSNSYEYAADITLSDIARFQRGNSL